jgi:hypothetical protein
MKQWTHRMNGCLVLIVYDELNGGWRNRIIAIEAEFQGEDFTLIKRAFQKDSLYIWSCWDCDLVQTLTEHLYGEIPSLKVVCADQLYTWERVRSRKWFWIMRWMHTKRTTFVPYLSEFFTKSSGRYRCHREHKPEQIKGENAWGTKPSHLSFDCSGGGVKCQRPSSWIILLGPS